jgi:hypothetical protein
MDFIFIDSTIVNKEISSGCPLGYEEYKRRCFKFGLDTTNYDSAQRICEQKKGNLASITSVYEYGISRGIAAKYNVPIFWIGLRSTNVSMFSFVLFTFKSFVTIYNSK